jgi:hypothetical protein
MSNIMEVDFKKIESKLNDAVKKSIRNTIDGAKFFFKDESEIHGYLRCQLQHCFKDDEQLKDLTDLIIPECRTKLFYHRESGTDNGVVYQSEDYEQLKKLGHKPTRAKLDFGIWNPKREIYIEGSSKPVPKVEIGIEVKRQRNLRQGEKKEELKAEMIKGLIEDCKELNDDGNKIILKYLIIIMFYPDIFTLDLGKDLNNNIGDINIVYCEINKEGKNITKKLFFPKAW